MRATLGGRIVAIGVTLILGAVITGVILVGSPAQGRIERLDKARIADLKGIMVAVDSFWARHQRLPADLEDLGSDPRADVRIKDPGSGHPYEYHHRGEGAYQLCATFGRESRAKARQPEADFWSHGTGRTCFDLGVIGSG